MNLFKTLNAVDQLPNNEIVKVINEAAITLAKRGEGYKVVREVEETIEHEGVMLRRVDRKARDGDYVRVQHAEGDCFKPNKLYGPVENGEVKADSSTGRAEYEIAAVYNDHYRRDTSTVEVFEVVGYGDMLPEQEVPIKSANQQRYETIQRAREFVEGLKKKRDGEMVYTTNCHVGYWCDAEFVVNKEKRTVVALLRWTNKNKLVIKAKGIAKCMPGDVFHDDIGKAIALARALKIDIPIEFLEAVQPDGVVAGMAVSYHNIYGDLKERTVERVKGDIAHLANGKRISLTFADEPGTIPVIIDDTNAVYANDTQ